MSAVETIIALSSASGRAGVAVIRISGPQVRFALETIAGGVPEPRKASLRSLRSGSGEVLDKALVLFFSAPASFTGEDVAEFHVHGSRAVVSVLLRELAALPGLRLAEAGEFTRRAFEAGKLDLAEVEGLADLIDSETEWQRRQALMQMEGALAAAVEGWRADLIQGMALLEAEIDFSDEGDVGDELLVQARVVLARTAAPLRDALKSFSTGERIRDGFVVVLAGPPNAGKSSLLNALARRDIAIVSPIAGTTRDAIEVRLDLGGLPVTLIDTAGLRASDDPIEREGVRRTLALIERADLLLDLRAIDSDTDRIGADNRIAIASKADLPGRLKADEIAISVQAGTGIEELLALLAHRLSELTGKEPALLTRERHRQAVANAIVALDRALIAEEAELAAEDVRIALRLLERLLGRVDVEDVLDALFAGFCIGK